MMFAKLLTEQDINKIKDKFFEDINNALDEAKRKHVSSFTNLTLFSTTSPKEAHQFGFMCCLPILHTTIFSG